MATKYGMLKAITGGVARATKDHEDTVKFLEDIKRKEEKDKIDANLKKAQTKSAEAQAKSILEKTARAKKEAEEVEAGYKNYTAGAKRAIEARQKQDEYLNKPFSLENEVPVGQEIQQIGQGDGSQITDGFQPSTPEFLSRAQFKERVDDPAKYKREQQADVTYSQKQADRLLKAEGKALKAKEKVEGEVYEESEANLSIQLDEDARNLRDPAKIKEKLERSEEAEFIDAKTIHGKIPHFNISVAVVEDFLEAVETDSDWEFRFAQQSYGTTKAREIWDKIMSNAIEHAEPGILNWDNLRSNNSYFYDPVISSNPCGEAILEPYGICDLGSLVLPNFITGIINTNWKKLEETIRLAIRFLDNVIDVNKYVLKQNDIKAHNSRRLGIGVMGLAEYLFSKKLIYGSEKAVYEVERLMRFIRDTAYQVSIELAMEKGAFPKFDSVQYGKAHFIRSLPASLRMDIKDKGIRNVTTMAIAPTGTISLLPEVTSGIEPLPFKAYMRSDKVGERTYIHPLYKDMVNNNEKIPEWFVDTADLKPADHFETQVAIQKYVDGAVSKTINLPKNATPSQLSRLTLEYIRDLKGVTVYVDGSREGQILNSVSLKQVKEYLKNKKEVKSVMDEDLVKCTTGSCEI